MTTTYLSGAAVPGGYYLNVSRWAIVPVAKDGEKLPEGKGEWRSIPTAAALLLVPVLGATFLMFLPMIGFGLLFQAMIAKVTGHAHAAATDLAATMSPGWQPGEAHLTGKSPQNAGVEEKGPIADEKLDRLAKEIAEKRQGK